MKLRKDWSLISSANTRVQAVTVLSRTFARVAMAAISFRFCTKISALRRVPLGGLKLQSLAVSFVSGHVKLVLIRRPLALLA